MYEGEQDWPRVPECREKEYKLWLELGGKTAMKCVDLDWFSEEFSEDSEVG